MAFRPQDLLRQVMITDVAISPDGQKVVYARRTIEGNTYRTRLWRVPYAGGRAERLTTADANDGSPAISPDGRTLLFVSDRSSEGTKDHPAQLWTMPLGGGEPARLTDLAKGAGPGRWSPDGRRIAFLAPSGEDRFIVGEHEDPIARRIIEYTWRLDGVGVRDQHTSAWVVAARGGRARRMTDPSYEVSQVAWSPDGERVGFLADRRTPITTIEEPQAWWVRAAEPSPPRSLASLPGEIGAIAWGPDGALVVIGSDEPDQTWAASTELRAFAVERGRARRLAPDLDRPLAQTSYGDLLAGAPDVVPPVWLDDRSVCALVSDRGRIHPWRIGLDGSAERLAAGDMVATGLAASAGRVVVVANEGANAGEVFAAEDGRLRRLTRNGSRWWGPFRREPRNVTLTHPDGHDVEVWALPARGRRRAPAVLDIHGGPNASFPPTPWTEMVALADAGISVVYANPRGSASYGRSYTSATEGGWGRIDASDQFLAVDWAVAEGIADPERLGVMGLSYGGFMTNWLLGRHPGRFKAGVSENPVTDLLGMFGSSDVGTMIRASRAIGGGGVPWDGLDDMIAGSPFTELHRNEAPLLLLVCEEDRRCPPEQSELIFAMLKHLGRAVEMVRYPAESHVMFIIGRPDRRVDRLERIVGWFRHHL